MVLIDLCDALYENTSINIVDTDGVCVFSYDNVDEVPNELYDCEVLEIVSMGENRIEVELSDIKNFAETEFNTPFIDDDELMSADVLTTRGAWKAFNKMR